MKIAMIVHNQLATVSHTGMKERKYIWPNAHYQLVELPVALNECESYKKVDKQESYGQGI